MSIKKKLLGLIVVTSLILVLGILFVVVNANSKLIKGLEESNYEKITKVVRNRINQNLDETEIALIGIAKNKEVIRLFKERDREGLIDLLMDGYVPIKSKMAQFQFHLPDSTSFLRLHKPEKFGDSLKAFRHTVNRANATKKTVKGIEEGKAGYGLRVVIPVAYKGEHLGTVEYGANFGEEFLKSLKDSFPGEYFIYALNSVC